MSTRTELVCDVCGSPATYSSYGMTGRVILDGRDIGQNVDLCDEHKPADDYRWQPRNTDRMYFYWSGRNGENLYPPK